MPKCDAPKGLLVVAGDVERLSGDDVVARRVALASAPLHPGEKEEKKEAGLQAAGIQARSENKRNRSLLAFGGWLSVLPRYCRCDTTENL